MNPTYIFTAKVWLWNGQGAWHFVHLPKLQSTEIQTTFKGLTKGWGSIPVTVTIGKTTWKTSIFPDKKSSSYLLPIKKEVRTKENITVEDDIEIKIEIEWLF